MGTSLLKRQIRKHLAYLSEKDIEKMQDFIHSIEEAYTSYEMDRELMERSLDISSEEMREKNESLHEKAESNKKIISNLLDAIEELDNKKINQESLEAFELSEYLKELIRSDIENKEKIIKHEKETQKLNTELEKFKLAVDNASDFIAILNADNEILYMNQSYLDYCGYTAKDLYGKRMRDTLRQAESQEFLDKTLWWLSKTKKPLSVNLKTRRKDGSAYISEVSFNPILNHKNKLHFYLLVERDITKELELDAMKNEFLSIASHELRTPMTIIKWYNGILLGEKFWKISSQQKKYIQRIDENVNRLIKIVNDMLDIGKLESWRLKFDFKKFDICELLKNDLHGYFNDLCEKKQISLCIEAENLEVVSDVEKIKQVMINLLGNAVKFTNEWWKIEVILEKLKKKKYKISVRDNWIGIPPQNMDNIFKKFYQVDNQLQKKEEWTWLGLSITKEIIEQLGWKIKVEKNPVETGTVFSFILDCDWENTTSAHQETQ